MIKQFLPALEAEISNLNLGNNPNELYEPIRYLMALGGKRIRPVLSLLSYSLFKNDWHTAIRPSLSIEIFHNFTLMHDDIMDKAPLRRGKATVHEKWNDNIAILSGDVMLVKAYDYLNEAKNLDLFSFQYLLTRFNKTAAEVCEGQQFDMNFENLEKVSIDDYLEMIRLKTSVLVGFSMELGALLAGESKEMASHLYQIGELVGLGFQLKDDFLDVYGDPIKFGKQVGGDILANKKTYLLINALEQAKGDEAKELTHWLQADNLVPMDKIDAVTKIYNSLGIHIQTEKAIQDYFDQAFEKMSQLDISEERKLSLQNFMAGLVDREV
ncbi:polyprenyl synthetase family protein [Aquirufa sp. ROCK-SH2]